MLKWAGALAASAVAGIAVGVGADRLLTPVKEVEKTVTETATQTRTVTSTATTTITQPAQTITQTSTATVTVTQTPPPPPSLKPPLSPEIKQRVEAIKNTLTAKHQGETIIYSGGCGINCGGGGGWDSGCFFKIRLKNGVITAIEADDTINTDLPREDEVKGNVEKVNLQRRPCVRGRAWRKYIYGPDRILYPLKRVGKRGEGKFVRISWGEALDTIAAKMKEMKEKYGPYSIGTMYEYQEFPNILAYFGCGATGWSTASFEATNFAGLQMMGAWAWIPYVDHEAPDIFNTKLIIMWGWDPTTSEWMIFTKYYLCLAKERGIPIIVIDPRYTASAEVYADQWIPIRPGTDVAMMLAMANVIFKEKLYDQEYVSKYVDANGLQKWMDYVLGKTDGVDKTPEWAEKICGVPAETIRELARLYAKSKPCHLNVSWAQARQPYGENVARAAIALHAITGNIGVPGGSSCLGGGLVARGVYDSPIVDYRQKPVPKTEMWGGTLPVLYCNWKWADAVLLREKVDRGELSKEEYNSIIGNAADNPMPNLHMLWINKNIFNQTVDLNKQIQAIMKMDFIVACGRHMTPSNKYADIILPLTDVMFEERHFFGNMYAPKIIEPLGEAKDLMWIQTQLAKRLGLLDLFMPLYTSDEEWDSLIERLHKEAYEKWAAERGINIPWDEFKKKPIIRRDVVGELNYPFKPQIMKGEKFNTKTGKIEIYSEYLATTDLKKTQYGGPIDPMPVYRPVWEGFYDPKAQRYPLMAITPHGRYRIHSVQDSNPWLSEDCYRHAVWINVADAKARGVKDGDLVRVYNDVGEMVIPAYVTSRIVPGVVCIYEGAWYAPNAQGVDRRGCSDIICHSESAAQRYPGAGAWPFVALVEVEKF